MKTIMKTNGVKIITPYINDLEIALHRQLFWEHDIYYEKDVAGIGSDLMFQKMWNKFPSDDIFILHSDMTPHHKDWFEELLEYVEKYSEAGMFGCLLLYPAKNKEKETYIQSAGGKINKDGRPDHFGSGLLLETGSIFKNDIEVDRGQYDNVREVAWTTFGGCYLRRSFIDSVGDFSAEYEWTYNRDVDYCMSARKAGQHIYQVPVRLYHHESKDNKIIKQHDSNKVAMEFRNLKRLQNKWMNDKLYITLDKIIDKR